MYNIQYMYQENTVHNKIVITNMHENKIGNALSTVQYMYRVEANKACNYLKIFAILKWLPNLKLKSKTIIDINIIYEMESNKRKYNELTIDTKKEILDQIEKGA